MAPMYAVVV